MKNKAPSYPSYVPKTMINTNPLLSKKGGKKKKKVDGLYAALNRMVLGSRK
jgi:hypothetical protein